MGPITGARFLTALRGIDIYGHNGVSVADIDDDGFDDLYVCQPAGLPNRLYRNRGDGTFEDITESSGLGILENTACALFADFNNRGRQDVIVVRANGPLLFVNEGGGKFRQKPDAFQFATLRKEHSPARLPPTMIAMDGSTFTSACTPTIRAPDNTNIRLLITMPRTVRRIS